MFKGCLCLNILSSHCRQHPDHLLLCKDCSAVCQPPHCTQNREQWNVLCFLLKSLLYSPPSSKDVVSDQWEWCSCGEALLPSSSTYPPASQCCPHWLWCPAQQQHTLFFAASRGGYSASDVWALKSSHSLKYRFLSLELHILFAVISVLLVH